MPNTMLRSIAKASLERMGLDDHARYLLLARTARGRRGLRDDRQLRFFLAATLAREANCIDVGANKGTVLTEIARLAPDGSHIAFEPIPALSEQLAIEFPSVELHAIALSDEDGDTTFHIANLPEWSGIRQRAWLDAHYESIVVPTRQLDTIVPVGRRVDFIKIDVEGAQVLVLKGAERVLSEHHPTIWFEHGERSAGTYGTSSLDVWHVLVERHGYRIWTADGDGPLDLAGFIAANDAPMWTYMAHQ